jgi:hypothetical protein
MKFNSVAIVTTLLGATTAFASDVPTHTLTVDGVGYAVFVHAGEAAVVETPALATLTRDGGRRGPACQDVDRNLSQLASQIESCKTLADVSDVCVFVRQLVDQVRFDPGTIGSSELEQQWAIATRASSPRKPDSVINAAASAASLPASAVVFVAQPSPVGPLAGPRLLVKPNGRSWASKLLGFIDLGDPAPTISATGRWVTRDHVLACGLQSGDVSIVWDQTASLSTGDALFSEDEIWATYQELQGSEFPNAGGTSSERALGVGAVIGKAIGQLPVAQDSTRFAAALALVFGAFFDPGTLEFANDLAEQDVRALVHGAALEYSLPWLGNVSSH